MAPHSVTRTLCTLLFLLPLVLCHMQMEVPSPLRDPHSNRTAEPKDYNILTPLHADGSDFPCKGYQLDTPLIPVATYEAGGTYELRLKGGATHGGGSCQISMSYDNGKTFKVIKSIIGGCPLAKSYEFTIPENAESAPCLFAWTWFNKVGNREMYMNCAVVDIVGAGGAREGDIDSVYAEDYTASAQASLSDLPDMFVANLKSVNDCSTRETVDVNFADPGLDVVYGDGMGASSSIVERSNRGACTGVGYESTKSSAVFSPSSDSSSEYPSGGSSTGADGEWHGDSDNQVTVNTDSSGSSAASPLCNDGQWHTECVPQPPQASATLTIPDSDAVASSNDAAGKDAGESIGTSADVADEDDSESSPKKHELASKSAHYHHAKPAGFYGGDNEEADSKYDYNHEDSYAYADGSDVYFNRQVIASRKLPEEEPTSVPGVDGDESSVVTDPGSAPDETVTSIAAAEGAPEPTEVPLYNEDDEPLPDPSLDAEDDVTIPATNPSLAEIALESAALSPNASLYVNTTSDAIVPEVTTPLDDDVSIDDQSDDLADSNVFDVGPWVEELAKLNQGPSIDGEMPVPDGFLPSNDISDVNPFAELSDEFYSPERVKQQEYSPTRPDHPEITGEAYGEIDSHSDDDDEDEESDGDVEAHGQCERPVYKCRDCKWPKRCTKINKCTWSCAHRHAKSSSTRSHSRYSRSSQSHRTITTANSTTAPPPRPTSSTTPLPPPTSCLPSPTPYATGNPNDFLPCKPGSFLCKSSTEFYTCGQFGGSQWTYGALRQVAAGMACQPNLVKGSPKNKRSSGWWITSGDQLGEDVERTIAADSDTGAERPSPMDDILAKLDKLSESVKTLLSSFIGEVSSEENNNETDGDTESEDDDDNLWNVGIKFVKRRFGWWVSSGQNQNGEEVDETNPLVIIFDKLDKLSKAIDRLSGYYNRSTDQTNKRSFGWWLSGGGYNAGEEDGDPLATILEKLNALTEKLEDLLGKKKDDLKHMKRAWGFWGTLGYDAARPEDVQNEDGELEDPFAPITEKLDRLAELVGQLLGSLGNGDDEGGGGKHHKHGRPHTWTRHKRQSEAKSPINEDDTPLSEVEPSEETDTPSEIELPEANPGDSSPGIDNVTASPAENVANTSSPDLSDFFPGFDLDNEDTIALDTLNEFDEFGPSSVAENVDANTDADENVVGSVEKDLDEGLTDFLKAFDFENDDTTAADTLNEFKKFDALEERRVRRHQTDASDVSDDSELDPEDEETDEDLYEWVDVCGAKDQDESEDDDGYEERRVRKRQEENDDIPSVEDTPLADLFSGSDLENQDTTALDALNEFQNFELDGSEGRGESTLRKRQFESAEDVEPDPYEDLAAAAEAMFGKEANPLYQGLRNPNAENGPSGHTGGDEDKDEGEDEKTETGEGAGEAPVVNSEDGDTPDAEEVDSTYSTGEGDSAPAEEEDSIPAKEEDSIPAEEEDTIPEGKSTLPEESIPPTPSTSESPTNTSTSSTAAQSDFQDAVLVPASEGPPENDSSEDADLLQDIRRLRRRQNNPPGFKFTDNDGVDSDPVALFGPEPKDYQEKHGPTMVAPTPTPVAKKAEAKAKGKASGKATGKATAKTTGKATTKTTGKTKPKNPPFKDTAIRRQSLDPVGKAVGKAIGGGQGRPAPAPAAVPLPLANAHSIVKPVLDPIGKAVGKAQPKPFPRPAGSSTEPEVDKHGNPVPSFGDLGSADASDVIALFPDFVPPDPVLDGLPGPDMPAVPDGSGLDTPVGQDDGQSQEEEDVGVPLEVNLADPATVEGESVSDESEEAVGDIADKSTAISDVPVVTSAPEPEPDVQSEDADTEPNAVPIDGPPPIDPPTSSLLLEVIAEAVATTVSAPTAFPILNTTAANSTAESLPVPEDEGEDEAGDWKDGILPFYSDAVEEPTSTVSADAVADILPYIMGPGPVIPDGVSIDWPGPSLLGDIPVATLSISVDAMPTSTSTSSIPAEATTAPTEPPPTVPSQLPPLPSVTDTWPPPLPGVTGAWPPPLPGVTIAPPIPSAPLPKRSMNKVEMVKRAIAKKQALAQKKKVQVEALLKKAVPERRNAHCPLVPAGYYRDDLYVRV